MQFFQAGAATSKLVDINDRDSGKLHVALRATDTSGVNPNAIWYHFAITMDIASVTCIDEQVGNFDFGAMANFTSQYSSPTSIGFNNYANYQKPMRIEVAIQEGTTPNTLFRVWLDDLIIINATAGPNNIVQFGIVTASGLFYLIMITTAIMYSASGFGTIMRVFSHGKGPKFLINPKVIIISGVVGTMGFLFMLIVGANLV